MAIKVSLGKLTLNFEEPFSEAIGGQLRENGVTVLPLDITHIGQVAVMPFHHRDPFDRLIVAQALVESLPIVGRDQAFDSYGVQRIW
jgi:PIN domain nuclease of toxin-antitoxin system